MKHLSTLTAAAALLIGASAANAADLTGPFGIGGMKDSSSSNSWTGYYAGINGGYGWDATQNFQNAFQTASNVTTDLSTGTRPAGWFGGLTAGANWQASGIVLGVETDIDLANIANDSAVKETTTTVTSSAATLPPPCAGVTAGGSTGVWTCTTTVAANGQTSAHSTIDWFGTLRARAGIPLTPGILVYGTGGLAYGGVSTRAVTANTALSADTTRFGWAAGAGADYKISPGWTFRTEWLHIDLGSDSLSGLIPANSTNVTANSQHNAFDIARVALVYRIGSDYAHPLN